MPESALTETYDSLREAIAWRDGFGRDPSEWSDEAIYRINRALDIGIRNVCYPEPVPPSTVPHVWSFMRPTYSFSTVAADYAYTMPDDFGQLLSSPVINDQSGRAPLNRVSESKIEELRAVSDLSGAPLVCAMRPILPDNGAAPQTWELLLHPTPDAAYPIRLRYELKVDTRTATRQYVPGGPAMAGLFRESCLAAAEMADEGAPDIHRSEFRRMLFSAIRREQSLSAPDSMGYCGDGPMRPFVSPQEFILTTYNGAPL